VDERLAVRLEGRLVTLEPLTPAHAERLWAVAGDPELWRWMPRDGGRDADAFRAWIDAALAAAAAGAEAPFATLRKADLAAIGSTRYLSLRPEHRGLEIGHTWLTRDAWGTGANAEAKLLLLEHAFERLGCIRVEFKTNARNERARRALEALPARFEGVFRKHMLVRDGEVRDSAWYAITDDEWPAVRSALERRVGAYASGR
jgi:RimJ/RimL family protein N-acetyltransferase